MIACFPRHRRGQLGQFWPLAVTITAGFSAHGWGESTALQGDPVQRLYTLLEPDATTGKCRLSIPVWLSFAEQLTKEVRAFRPKQNPHTDNLSFEAETESNHDDLVVALALALWWPHKHVAPRQIDADTGQAQDGQRSLHDSAPVTD